MSTKIANASSKETSLQGLDTVLPVSRREVFWRPKYLAASAYLEHLPVLFWLVGDLRPQAIVTLGGDGGDMPGSAVAHLALCQAVERLGLDADCTGLNTWADDFDTVADYADTQYGEFSRLVEIPDATAPGLFDAGGIDLLVVDRDLSPALLEGLGAWADRLGDEACLVLRGTEAARRDPELAAALEAFRSDRPVLRFPHGDGVWVMAAGAALPARLARLAEIEGDRSLFRSMQQVFQRLGAACANEWTARDAARIQAGALKDLEALRESHAARGADIEQLRQAAAEAERAWAKRIADLESELKRRANLAEAEVTRLSRALKSAETERADLRASKAAELTELRTAQATEIARLEQALAEARADTGARDALEATHREETARLTALLAERDAEIASLREKADTAHEDARAARTALDEASASLTALRAEQETRDAEFAALREEADTAREDARAARAALDEAGASLTALQTEQEARDAEIASLREEADTAREDARATRAALQAGQEARDAEIASLREEAETAREEARAARAALQAGQEARDAEIASLREEAETAREDARAARSSLTDSVASLTALLAEGEEREAALARDLSQRPETDGAAAETLQAALEDRDAEIARLRREIKETTAVSDRARAAYEADARRATEDRATALKKLAALRKELEALRGGAGAEGRTGDLGAALAARDLALGEAVQGRERLEQEIADLRGTVDRQARELAELVAGTGVVADPRATRLAERAAAELKRSEREASDLAAALRASQDARAAADAELENTKRELARMTGRKEHLETRIRTELGG